MPGLFDKILGHPFVYDQVRPRVIGGIDMKPLYELLGNEGRRAVLDVGCGTGDALKHLAGTERYLGIDTDPIAIEAARRRYGSRPDVSFESRYLKAADVIEFEPTGVVLSGVLHHLTNDEAQGVFQLALGSPHLQRIVTADIVFLPGRLLNNVFAMMDRGRYCREPDAYAAIARRAGLEVKSGMMIEASPGNDRVSYYLMALEPR
jgi:SAM-dependent methyltransferase